MMFDKSNKSVSLGVDFTVFLYGNPFTLDRGIMSVGGGIPTNLKLVTPDLKGEYFTKGRKIIYTVPSLDTPVCEIQIKELSKSLEKKKDNFICDYYVVSIDTPFAQARFIRENNITPKICFLSDYASHQFSSFSGLRIKELGLLTRSIIICNEQNIIEDVILPQEITQTP